MMRMMMMMMHACMHDRTESCCTASVELKQSRESAMAARRPRAFTLYRLAPFAQSLLCSCDLHKASCCIVRCSSLPNRSCQFCQADFAVSPNCRLASRGLHYLKGRLQVAPELEAGGPACWVPSQGSGSEGGEARIMPWSAVDLRMHDMDACNHVCYMHDKMHACLPAYIHKHLPSYAHMYTVHTCVHTSNIIIHTHSYIHTCTHVYMCYACMQYVFASYNVCVGIHISTHTPQSTDIQNAILYV